MWAVVAVVDISWVAGGFMVATLLIACAAVLMTLGATVTG